MAKSAAQREYDQADRAFRKAWKLLDRIERRLEEARATERKRLSQLGDGTGPDAVHRTAQLEVARAEVVEIERLLTELSDLIARHARMTTGQTVQDVATLVAAEIKDEAAEAPTLSTPSTRRNRHHRPRRRAAEPGGGAAAAADVGGGPPPDLADPEHEPDAVTVEAEGADAEPTPAPAATRRNRHHRPRRRPAEGAETDGAAPEAETLPAPVIADVIGADTAGPPDAQVDEPPEAEPELVEAVAVAAVEPAPIAEPEAGESDPDPAPEATEAAVDDLEARIAPSSDGGDPIIELPSPATPEPPPDAAEPPVPPEPKDPWDSVEWSDSSEQPEPGGHAGA